MLLYCRVSLFKFLQSVIDCGSLTKRLSSSSRVSRPTHFPIRSGKLVNLFLHIRRTFKRNICTIWVAMWIYYCPRNTNILNSLIRKPIHQFQSSYCLPNAVLLWNISNAIWHRRKIVIIYSHLLNLSKT